MQHDALRGARGVNVLLFPVADLHEPPDGGAVFLAAAQQQEDGILAASKTPYVFVIPVACELDLKKAAKAVGEKSVAMLHVSELTPLTGYVRGGCSPVGMKKQFRTVFAAQALAQETILVSAGKIGYQVETAPQSLIALVRATTADLTIEES